MEAIQIPKKKADDHQFHYGYTMPQGPGADLHEALLSDGAFQEEIEYDDVQLGIAATMVAADLIKTGGFGAPSVDRNLDIFAPAIPDRGRFRADFAKFWREDFGAKISRRFWRASCVAQISRPLPVGVDPAVCSHCSSYRGQF